MPAPVRYDVVVAGAGPAGCAAALALHRAGRRVCLVDDEAPATGYKAGEALPGAARRLLRQLGIAGPEALLASTDFHACQANASAWGSEQWTHQSALANPEGGGWHLHRAAFDAALARHAEAAGVPRYRARIEEVRPLPAGGPAGYALRLRPPAAPTAPAAPTLGTAWLVDATGRRAYLSRQMLPAREQLDQQMAAVGWVASAAADHDCTTRIKSVAEGWWYTARLPGGRRVIGFHGLPAAVAAHVKNPAAFLGAFDAAGLLPDPVAAAPLLMLRGLDASVGRLPQVAAPGLLAVGDAALSFDPLSSQGMLFALYSGMKGAEAIVRATASPAQCDLALHHYQAQVNQVFEANQRSRKYFYASELRFAAAPYWQARLATLVSR